MDIPGAHAVMDKYARRIEHPDIYNVSICKPWRIIGFVVYLKTAQPVGGFHAERITAQVAHLCTPYLGDAAWEHISEPVKGRPLHKHIYRCVLMDEEKPKRVSRAIGWAVESTKGYPSAPIGFLPIEPNTLSMRKRWEGP